MRDPYIVLGMPQDATIEQLRERYEQLKSQYSEARFLDGEAGNEAAKNLSELEDAFKLIEQEHEKKKAKEQHGSDLYAIDSLIKQGKYDEAQALLDAIVNRSAEWHYLQSIIFYKREWTSECKAQLTMAVNMEPWNEKYKNALNKLQMVMGNSKTDPRTIGVDPQSPPPVAPETQMCNNCSNCCCMYLFLDCCCSMSHCI